MSDSVRVLTLVRYYLPGYKSGGPLRTIAGMVQRLGDGFQFKIITSDRDMLDKEPYKQVTPNSWNSLGGADVYYCSPSKRSWRTLRKLVAETGYDVLYLNSFCDPLFTIQLLLLRRLRMIPDRPVVLAPRGEFSEEALRMKAWKKRPYVWLAKRLGLLRGVLWQASSAHEVEDIRRVLGRWAREIMTAADLAPSADAAEPQSPKRKEPGVLRVVFLSRISPMKNLDGALRLLARVQAKVEFNVYGPVEDKRYWKECQSLMSGLPENVVCRYLGPVEPRGVLSVIADHDLFLLPTLGENYGHVILEALLAGTPVLISDQTPWRNLEKAGVGWDVPLGGTDSYRRIIEQCAGMDAASYEEWRTRVREFGLAKLEDAESVQANRELLLKAVTAAQPHLARHRG
jgi:glycosyltransferase involved in cell wall biosynthesis